MPTPPTDDGNEGALESNYTVDVEVVRSSMRLFVRNLPYDVKEEHLETEFAPFGNLEEVSYSFPIFSRFLVMNVLIGTADAIAI